MATEQASRANLPLWFGVVAIVLVAVIAAAFLVGDKETPATTPKLADSTDVGGTPSGPLELSADSGRGGSVGGAVVPDAEMSPAGDPDPDKPAAKPPTEPGTDVGSAVPQTPESQPQAPTTDQDPKKTQTTSAVGLGGSGGGRASKLPPRPKEGSEAHRIMVGNLGWLAAHQNKQGYWSPQSFDGDSTRRKKRGVQATHNIEFVAPRLAAGDQGTAECQVMATALALASFGGVGYTHKDGEHRLILRESVLYFRKVQHSNGLFDGSRDLRDHALATYAMVQAWGNAADQVLKPIVDKALEFLLSRRVPGSGWGSLIDSDEFDSPNVIDTFYAVLTLTTAQLAGWDGDVSEAMTEAVGFLAQLHRGGGQVWYSRSEADAPRSLVAGCTRGPINEAAWAAAMLLCGGRVPTDSDVVAVALRVVHPGALPTWAERCVDYEQWWIGTLACSLASAGSPEGVSVWDSWGPAIHNALVPNQRGSHRMDQTVGLTSPELLAEHGSWDAVSPWSNGGRVEATAFAALTLQVYHRHHKQESKKD